MIKQVLFVICIGLAFAAIPADLVTNMPEWPQNRNFSMYSGYLNLTYTNQKQLHYVFITKTGTTTVNNTAPVLLWLNGGPGCSSLEGFLVENGPYVLEDGMTSFNGTFNIWGWNNLANVLYIESPAGVGFSTTNLPYNTTYQNDNVTTLDNYEALQSFFSGYPEFLHNDLYLSGESYGGIYVPHLAAMIDTQNDYGVFPKLNLKGFMVGNSVMGLDPTPYYNVQVYYGHHFITTSTWNDFLNICMPNMNSPQCQAVMDTISDMVYGIDPYFVYGYCWPAYAETEDKPKKKWSIWNKETGRVNDPKLSQNPPCVYVAGITGYLNRADVKQALHVSTNITWSICNGDVGNVYGVAYNGSLGQYQQLLDSGKYRIMVYNGDADTVCPWSYNEHWVEFFNLPTKSDWSAWYLNGQVSGFVKEYQGLRFVTVKGAGHMVPQVKRPEAYTMVQAFLNNQSLTGESRTYTSIEL